MHIAHLELTNFRTFRRLEIDLQPGIHVVTAPNASGKTNLLEAVALIATTRSARSGADVDLISWDAIEEEPLPAARLSARVEAADGVVDLAVAVVTRPGRDGGRKDGAGKGSGGKSGEGLAASRRFQVNGVARRASDLIGRLRVVMFSATDLGIIS
ncbi:MAG: AAA family ATPase, partial [Dehalococcoidia bacterium]|nr:AAA family ATPase [Dehalococcoidia bacterium]